MRPPERSFDFLIAGGGVTATALAALLLGRGLAVPGRVALITGAAPPPSPAAITPADLQDWDTRVFALNRASQRLLEIAGAWARIPPDRKFPYERMCIWDAAGAALGPGCVTFDSAEQGEPDLGCIVDGRELHRACRAAAAAAGAVTIEAGIASVRSAAAAIGVTLDDGRALQGALLIGADGVASPTRRALGIDTAGHAYQQDALVAHLRTALPHRSTAWQRFLPGGPLALLPLGDGRSSLVWSVARAESVRLRALDPVQFGAAATAASAAVLGDCELTTALVSVPLQLQYAVDYVRPRAALVGDAAHVVHPLAGQGLNLGLLDCATLVDVLPATAGAVAAALADQRALRRYERRRRGENMIAAAGLDALERLFSSAARPLAGARVLGLSAVERLPFVKRALAARALGLRGELPAFLS